MLGTSYTELRGSCLLGAEGTTWVCVGENSVQFMRVYAIRCLHEAHNMQNESTLIFRQSFPFFSLEVQMYFPVSVRTSVRVNEILRLFYSLT
jgi:hypothetical protein